MNNVLTIAVAGGTGSGKSTLTNRLSAEFPDDVAVIRFDDYYKPHHELTYEERCALNYDDPSALDFDLFISNIDNLRRGFPVEAPVYDFVLHDRSDMTITVMPARVIVAEGILLLSDEALLPLFDIKIYVDTDDDIRILRRITRDVKERGRTLESVIKQYTEFVKPMHEKYVAPSRKNADIIIPEGGINEVAVDMLLNKIKRHIG